MATPTNINKEEFNRPTNGTDCKAPAWLKAELFEDVLKDNIPGYKKVKTFNVSAGIGAGENYATIMLRVVIEAEVEEGKTKSLPFMIKVSHDSEIFKELLKKTNMFEIERGMYMDIVPEFEQMYHDAGVKVKFGPKCYNLNVSAENVLLEDLRPKGFRNANRLEGLDMNHMHCVLKKLAQWHAASAMRVETKGMFPDIYLHSFFKPDHKDQMEQMTKAIGAILLKCMENYDGHESYIDAVRKLQPAVVDIIFKLGKVDPNEFNVLNHGDCWANNIMFQYDAFGKIKETYFVDYQIPKYGPVAQDLMYFILSSSKLELKLSKFDYFIKYYYDNLIEHLQLLKYPKNLPTLKDIHIQLYKYGTWGYNTATGVMGAVLLDPTEEASFDNFVSDSAQGSNLKMLIYSNARYRKHMEALMPWLHNRGALEC